MNYARFEDMMKVIDGYQKKNEALGREGLIRKDEKLSAPVSRAAQKGHFRTVELFLKEGADPSADGYYVLRWAMMKGYETIERLIYDRMKAMA